VAQTTLDRPRTSARRESGHLRREVGLVGLTMMSLGSIIGSGWLLGALTAAKAAGPASLISWVMAGVFIAVLALIHSELGATYPVSGGTARFPHLAFGGLGGFTAGWMAWLQAVTIAPIEVEAALAYLDNKWHGLVTSSATLTHRGLLVAAGLMLLFTIVNIMGVRWLSDTNVVTVFWKFAIPVITIIALLAVSFHGSNFHGGGGFAPFGAKGIFMALPLGVVFAMQGFEQAIQVGGEARNPQRDLPRAVISAMLIGTVLYLLLEIAFIGSLHPSRLVHGWGNPIGAGEFGPYATLATGLGLGWLATLLYIDAFISPAGTGLVYLGTSSRLSYGLGRNGDVAPGTIDYVGKRGVPVFSILLAFVVGLIVFLPFPSWQNLVALVTGATSLMYAFAPVTLGALRRADPERPRPYRLPMAWLLSPFGFIAANLIFYWGGWKTDQKLLVAVLIGFALFAVSRTFSGRGGERSPISWRAAAWIAPWLGGLAVISWLGQYDGRGVIPFWVDLAVIAVFSVAIYALAVRSVLSSEEVQLAIEIEEQEAALTS
jgi:amino acid transporter